MWLLLLVAVGSGYLANCWRDALLLQDDEEQEDGDAAGEIMNKDRRTCKRLFGNTSNGSRNETQNSDGVDVGLSSQAGLEVKRMRDCQKELDSQNQLLLNALTSSFLDSSALANHWLAPSAQEGRMIKSKTPGKSAKSRAASRRSRYMRAPPKPVTSLESCLRAQLHLDEDKCLSQPPVFHPGLRQVESLDSSAMVFRGGTAKNIVSRVSKIQTAAVKASVDALLFSFGVGLGVMHTATANGEEIARLQNRLEEAEKLVQELRNSSHGNMADLEAQLEAELELMQLHSSELDTELDTEDVGEVVHDQLNVSGLPGASDLEDERNGEVSNWAVSPRELDKRLRLLLETQQEERIAKLEEQLEQTEAQLHDREEELLLWKERVRLLTEQATSYGQAGGEVKRSEREQSPGDDICDEFLKSVDALLDSELSSNLELEEGVFKKEEESSSSHSSSVWKWKYSGKFNAGAATPLEDKMRSRNNQLLNTPRRPEEGGATVVDKIRYWENVSKCTSNINNNEQQQQSPVLRLSCSEFSSSCDDEDDDASWMSDVEEREMMKRIVEKSRKGSTLVRDVELMLAALECGSA